MKVPARLWPRVAWTLYRSFGIRGGFFRFQHEMRRALGSFHEAPRLGIEGTSVGGDPLGFAVDAGRFRAAVDMDGGIGRADRVASGEYQAFRWRWRTLPMSASDWLKHPSSGATYTADTPWWRVAHLSAEKGDIKEVWEPGRFAWVYDLVRGYLLSGDDRYAAAFHRLFADWVESSPPFRGVHWSCGQETTIRATALLYAEANLRGAPSSSPEAMARLQMVLAASGERVRDAIGYALSQRNNHGISEAVGLVMLGVRFQAQHPEAQEWVDTGHQLLERLIREQIADDGWYTQHSFNYHRLALEQCVIGERALRRAGRSLSPASRERLQKALELLLLVIDADSGIVPNYGSNDGAFVHPITQASYRDYRPLVTAAAATWKIPIPENIQLDAEVLAWLEEAPPPSRPAIGDGVWSGPSGWAVARVGGTAVFLRAGRYESRPGHLDTLHLDVRFSGRETIVDPGSYAYNAPPPWRNGLVGAAVHNGPIVDRRDHGVRGPRFLWYLWPEAELLGASASEVGCSLIAQIPGRVRRTVTVRSGEVVVEDQILDPDAKEAVVTWLLHPEAGVEQVEAPSAVMIPASEGSVDGWFSPCYGVREASTAVRVSWAATGAKSCKVRIRSA